MKVYLVRAHADVPYDDRDSWSCGIFASRKAAEKYVNEQPKRFAEDQTRISELNQLTATHTPHTAENDEYIELNNRWCWHTTLPIYYIDEFELQYG